MNDVKHHGLLNGFSFSYKNKLGQLKKMIRKPQFPIQQIVCRLAVKQQIAVSNAVLQLLRLSTAMARFLQLIAPTDSIGA